mmetsp:Transcript_20578/g.42922  ORF Transcript_20578/g.42922 Transcript_20578/m.42922 type:complete len:87 (-) Transcript_20578:17-277(-)
MYSSSANDGRGSSVVGPPTIKDVAAPPMMALPTWRLDAISLDGNENALAVSGSRNVMMNVAFILIEFFEWYGRNNLSLKIERAVIY